MLQSRNRVGERVTVPAEFENDRKCAMVCGRPWCLGIVPAAGNYAIEAKHIEAATRKPRVALPESRAHDLAEFSGQPCPFLKDSSCSIYDARPFACRKHVSFDTTNYWCQPERSHQKELPMIRFDGAEEAFFNVTGRTTHGVFGDIRDFFPGLPVKT